MSHDTHKRDFSTNARLPGISALAAGIGALSTLAAFVLLSLIHLFTNLFFFGSILVRGPLAGPQHARRLGDR